MCLKKFNIKKLKKIKKKKKKKKKNRKALENELKYNYIYNNYIKYSISLQYLQN